MTQKQVFGKQILKYLEIYGLTITDFAQLIKSNSTYVQNIINGTANLGFDKVIEICELFGMQLHEFANSNVAVKKKENIHSETKDLIEKRKITGVKTKDKNHALANELNRLIKEGSLNQPNTAKNLLTYMTPSLWKRNPSEITSLLNKAPRNESIVLIRPIKGVNYYIHKDFKGKYATLSDEEILALVVPFESPDNEKNKS